MKLRRKTEAKIEQVASAMELDTNAVMQVLRETAASVKVTDTTIDEFNFVISRGAKVYNETLAAYKEKMTSLGKSLILLFGQRRHPSNK